MGSYGLMKAASGCPGNNVHWQSGWRKQDTEDINAHNYFSPKIGSYMAGECVTLLTNTYTDYPHFFQFNCDTINCVPVTNQYLAMKEIIPAQINNGSL
mgnify:FL=1